jgi:O-6-methylguanine DNA methyltransferase
MNSFREKVYRVVKKIPKGKIMTYKEVAKAVCSPRSWRAVGNALNKNQSSKVPCHRVIKSNGEIGGYRKGAKKKIEILKSEHITSYVLDRTYKS